MDHSFPIPNRAPGRPGSRWRTWRRSAAVAIVAAATVTGFALHDGEEATAALAADNAISSSALQQGQQGRFGPGLESYAPVVERVAPAVVTIRSSRAVHTAEQFPFFGQRRQQNPQGRERREGGLGSGLIVSADGYVLTNHHVIAGAEDITVELSDRRTFPAKVVGSDPPSDLAVLRIHSPAQTTRGGDPGSEGSGFPTLPLGNSDQVRVGDVVLALGNPLGIGQTVTMGIISAKGRATGIGDGSYEDFLQTDAPVNRGNSGGPLVNLRGELVGINSQILSPSGGNIGVAFAIPANMAKHVMDSLLADGRVRRGQLGVTVQSLTPELTRELRLASLSGALISSVQPGGPAATAGLQAGDVVTAINGTPVVDSNALRNIVAQSKPGAAARLDIVRDGRAQSLTATLNELATQPGVRG